MTKTTSVYLDGLRFMASVAVFFLHSTYQGFTGRWLWQLVMFGEDAVMAFFILSGYVIAFCAEHKHDTFSDYMIARLSRLWSVDLPALVLTGVLDYIGWSITDSYARQPDLLYAYVLSAFFVNQLWFIHVVPGSNNPFWSLGYEFLYYVFFAAIYYLQYKMRWFAAIVIVAVAGPK